MTFEKFVKDNYKDFYDKIISDYKAAEKAEKDAEIAKKEAEIEAEKAFSLKPSYCKLPNCVFNPRILIIVLPQTPVSKCSAS